MILGFEEASGEDSVDCHRLADSNGEARLCCERYVDVERRREEVAGDRVTCLQQRAAACEGIDIIDNCVLCLSPFSNTQ